MTNDEKLLDQAGVILGKQLNEYKSNYDASLLVPVDRFHNRFIYNIEEDNLPFCGYDTWNIYEISFLNNSGFPIAASGKLVYPANSKKFIESKSLKLYFYSFNMEKMGNTIQEAITNFEEIVRKDISKAIGYDVSFNVLVDSTEWEPYSTTFTPLSDLVDFNKITVSNFNENPDILKVINNTPTSTAIQTNILRSNCRVTHQPDWADIFISYTADSELDLISLTEYLVSFRNENHFHEEVVEMIFKRLYDKLKPKELTVFAIYTRRGGIDICPVRSTNFTTINNRYLGDSTKACIKTSRQ